VFQIAFGRIGGTELRMLVILVNTIVFARLPGVATSGLGLFDAAVGTAVGLLTVTLLRDAFATARSLDRAERAAWKQDGAMG
jgi:hypothetical protein